MTLVKTGGVVAAIDPGQTSGVAAVRLLRSREFGVLYTGEVLWEQRGTAFKAFLLRWNPDLILLEDFKLFAGKATAQANSRMPSSQLIGRIEQVIEDLGWESRLQFVQPGSENRAKNDLTAAQRKSIGSSQHALDSLAHCANWVLLNT